MPKRFEYDELPPEQVKANEANAAKAVEDMLAEAE